MFGQGSGSHRLPPDSNTAGADSAPRLVCSTGEEDTPGTWVPTGKACIPPNHNTVSSKYPPALAASFFSSGKLEGESDENEGAEERRGSNGIPKPTVLYILFPF